MTTAVRCVDVSKKYMLGQTRTSILGTISNSIKRVTGSGKPSDDHKAVLWALNEVSFELSRGDSLGLVGKNGAGKSTMLKLLANITNRTTGRIDINGRLSALIELGSGFHPDLTGRENVFLNGTILGLSRSDVKRRYDEIVAFSELEQFIDTPIKRYSSGMLVRLGFAVASCIEPDILLVDEVLAVGDASFRQKCLRRIQELLDAGTSIIFVSHNINMVQAVCSRAVYLKRGQVAYSGDVKEAVERYEQDLHVEEMQNYERDRGNTRIEGGHDVQITGVDVRFHGDGDVEALTSEDGIEVRVNYEALRPMHNINAVVRIVRADGITCCRVRSSIDGAELSLPAGSGSFSVIIDPLQLIGGAYFAEAYITHGSDLVILTNRQSDWFHVRGGPLSSDKNSGVFEPRRRWLASTDAIQVADGYTEIR